ncbi:MAG: cold shock domain-containing protein, partial [Pseudomonadota bacterium]
MAEENVSSGSVITGLVKWYDAVKGYGFVVPDDGGSDVMVHASCVRNFGVTALNEGARVKVATTMGARGLHAQELLEIDDVGTATDVMPAPPVPAMNAGPRPTDFLSTDAEVADAGRMDHHVATAIVGHDKAVTLYGIVPFDQAG